LATPAETAGVSTINGLHLQTSLTALPAVKGLPARLTNHRAAFTTTTPDATSLVRYDAACRALAEAHRVDEVKSIRDKAVAMQAYARQAKDSTLITQATDIRMRAERRAGELLIEMAKKGDRVTREQTLKKGRGRPVLPRGPKLADLGINKTQSSRWQKLAALETDNFEAEVERSTKTAYDRTVRSLVRDDEVKRAQRRHRRVIEHGCTVSDLVALAASGKRFPLILGDPPWPWETWSSMGRKWSDVTDHYDTCTIEEIKALPVAPLAAEDCVLVLWATWPKLPEALEVIKAWGFTYKTCAFVWVKQNPSEDGLHMGMGYYTRSNSELCLLATRGSPQRLVRDVHQVVLAPVGEHSAKPEEVRRRIERLLAGPYLELYGRKAVPGWTVWGNEIARDQFGAPVLETAE
jgi:N6-adenosine-specific RNA methylase IME4